MPPRSRSPLPRYPLSYKELKSGAYSIRVRGRVAGALRITLSKYHGSALYGVFEPNPRFAPAPLDRTSALGQSRAEILDLILTAIRAQQDGGESAR